MSRLTDLNPKGYGLMVLLASILVTDCTHTYEDKDFLSHSTCTLSTLDERFLFFETAMRAFGHGVCLGGGLCSRCGVLRRLFSAVFLLVEL